MIPIADDAFLGLLPFHEQLQAERYLSSSNCSIRSDATESAIAPDSRDLARLHNVVRRRRAMTILEFGVGFSTAVMAHALVANRDDFERAGLSVRRAHRFELHVVDTSTKWLSASIDRLPSEVRKVVHPHQSPARVGDFGGRICHFYDEVPDIVPDIIYLDGPDPAAVTGSMNGQSFACPDRTVMAGDLLRIESTLLPRSLVVIDGRTNNARFLATNLQRPWATMSDPIGDYSAFDLCEPPLGPFSSPLWTIY